MAVQRLPSLHDMAKFHLCQGEGHSCGCWPHRHRPREAIKEDKDETMGLYFKGDRPTLETTENDFEVKVNDVTHDGIGSCCECGREESHDSLYDDGSCFYCGPIEDDEDESWY